MVGGESTSKKSTLAAMLGERLSAVVVSEFLRIWIDQHQDEVPSVSDRQGIMAAQHDSRSCPRYSGPTMPGSSGSSR